MLAVRRREAPERKGLTPLVRWERIARGVRLRGNARTLGNAADSARLEWLMRGLAAVALTIVAARSASAEPSGENFVYAELGGKGGLYGVGFERSITSRLALGIAGSYLVLRDQTIATLAPYVHGTIKRGVRNALFAEVGAAIVHSKIPSPVDDWDGMSDTGGGGFASLGWEHTLHRHVELRLAGSVVAGEGGVVPWIGFAIGARP